jgi:hypothetical protein
LFSHPAPQDQTRSPSIANHRPVCGRGGKLVFAALVFAILRFDDWNHRKVLRLPVSTLHPFRKSPCFTETK